MNKLRNTSELLDRAEITLTNALLGFDKDDYAFKNGNEDLIVTIRLAIEIIIQAQNELSECNRKTSWVSFY